MLIEAVEMYLKTCDGTIITLTVKHVASLLATDHWCRIQESEISHSKNFPEALSVMILSHAYTIQWRAKDIHQNHQMTMTILQFLFYNKNTKM